MNKISGYLLFFIVSAGTLAQDLVIFGVVKDHEQKPLPFATVGIKGSSNGTITNLDGAFEIYLDDTIETDTLFVSYLGYESALMPVRKAIGQGTLAFTLTENIIVLDEVQVQGERLTGVQIIKKVLEKIKDNFPNDPFIMSGFFRDIRDQNDETVYLVDALVDIKDPGFHVGKNLPKKFYLKKARGSDNRINDLLSSSYLNTRNVLGMIEYNYWLNKLKSGVNKLEFELSDFIKVDDKFLYVISTEEIVSKGDLAVQYKDMKYKLTHRYYIDSESYAIHKIEHLEDPIEGKYVGIERPYEGDTLFYSKKGWNQIIGFEEFEGKMHLKYHDISYAFDIVNQKQGSVYLDMEYRFTFSRTSIETNATYEPLGVKMNKRKSLTFQTRAYDPDFWENPANTKLVPLTDKQLRGLEKYRPLDEQFRDSKSAKQKKS